MSARNCIAQSLAASPPSTRNASIASPQSALIAAIRSRVWNPTASSVGARDLRQAAFGGQTAQRAARAGLPIRRAEPGKSRHEIDALARVGLCREVSGLGRGADRPEPVAQPLHRGAGDKNAAFERIGGLAAEPVGERRQQPVARRGRPRAGMQQREGAGAVGRFDHARRESTPARSAPRAGRRPPRRSGSHRRTARAPSLRNRRRCRGSRAAARAGYRMPAAARRPRRDRADRTASCARHWSRRSRAARRRSAATTESCRSCRTRSRRRRRARAGRAPHRAASGSSTPRNTGR